MEDLVTWLRARLDEDEEAAQAATPAPWEAWHTAMNGRTPVKVSDQMAGDIPLIMCESRLDAEHIALHDPARVLREVESKRALLELHDDDGGAHECPAIDRNLGDHYTGYERCCPTLRLLAAAYADRPGYQEEWKP